MLLSVVSFGLILMKWALQFVSWNAGVVGWYDMGVNYICFTSGTSDNNKSSRKRTLRLSFGLQLLHLTNTEYMSTHEKLHFLCQQDVESSPKEPQRGGQRWFRCRVRTELGAGDRPVRLSRDQQVPSWVRKVRFFLWNLWFGWSLYTVT